MKKFSIITLGCRVNQCESDSLSERMRGLGWEDATEGGAADVVIVNTCCVTGKAAMQSRQAARMAHRTNPGARILVTGCYAQVAPEEICGLKEIDGCLGNAEKHRIPEILSSAGQDPSESLFRISELGAQRSFAPLSVPAGGKRTRPVLKIQDGCNAFCTYCIVPYARGRSRSMPAADVLGHVLALEKNGFLEVVLSGIHLGAYGLDLAPPLSLAELLAQIAAETEIPRIRLSSIESTEITKDMVSRIAGNPRFCPHFHIPLQSGDDPILKRMGRPYTAAQFAEKVLEIREKLPGAAIGADVLVGFPGETDASFRRTCALIERLPLSYLHVFPFSARPGTPAYQLSGRLLPETIRQRCARIRSIGRAKRSSFVDSHLGQTLSVLVEGRRDPKSGMLKGTTPNYLSVLLAGPDALQNRIVSCLAHKRTGDSLLLASLLAEPASEYGERP